MSPCGKCPPENFYRSLEYPGSGAAKTGPASDCQRMRILVVEDHADTANLLSQLLQKKGYSVMTAGSVAGALKILIGQKFDLILSDVALPDSNGVSLLHGIRQFCNTPAIAVTAYSGAEDVSRCLKAGFSAHLAKPLDFAQLEKTIKEVVPHGAGKTEDLPGLKKR